jgi:hypothetical protein
MRPNILPIIGWFKSFDLLDAINTGKIIVARLAKGALGDETAQILYAHCSFTRVIRLAGVIE